VCVLWAWSITYQAGDLAETLNAAQILAIEVMVNRHYCKLAMP